MFRLLTRYTRFESKVAETRIRKRTSRSNCFLRSKYQTERERKRENNTTNVAHIYVYIYRQLNEALKKRRRRRRRTEKTKALENSKVFSKGIFEIWKFFREGKRVAVIVAYFHEGLCGQLGRESDVSGADPSRALARIQGFLHSNARTH